MTASAPAPIKLASAEKHIYFSFICKNLIYIENDYLLNLNFIFEVRMKSMKKIVLTTFYITAATTSSIFAEEPVCHHCEDIREYNAANHQNFEYYDEYLKSNNPRKDDTFDQSKSQGAERNSPVPKGNANSKPATNGSKPKN